MERRRVVPIPSFGLGDAAAGSSAASSCGKIKREKDEEEDEDHDHAFEWTTPLQPFSELFPVEVALSMEVRYFSSNKKDEGRLRGMEESSKGTFLIPFVKLIKFLPTLSVVKGDAVDGILYSLYRVASPQLYKFVTKEMPEGKVRAFMELVPNDNRMDTLRQLYHAADTLSVSSSSSSASSSSSQSSDLNQVMEWLQRRSRRRHQASQQQQEYKLEKTALTTSKRKAPDTADDEIPSKLGSLTSPKSTATSLQGASHKEEDYITPRMSLEERVQARARHEIEEGRKKADADASLQRLKRATTKEEAPRKKTKSSHATDALALLQFADSLVSYLRRRRRRPFNITSSTSSTSSSSTKHFLSSSSSSSSSSSFSSLSSSSPPTVAVTLTVKEIVCEVLSHAPQHKTEEDAKALVQQLSRLLPDWIQLKKANHHRHFGSRNPLVIVKDTSASFHATIRPKLSERLTHAMSLSEETKSPKVSSDDGVAVAPRCVSDKTHDASSSSTRPTSCESSSSSSSSSCTLTKLATASPKPNATANKREAPSDSSPKAPKRLKTTTERQPGLLRRKQPLRINRFLVFTAADLDGGEVITPTPSKGGLKLLFHKLNAGYRI